MALPVMLEILSFPGIQPNLCDYVLSTELFPFLLPSFFLSFFNTASLKVDFPPLHQAHLCSVLAATQPPEPSATIRDYACDSTRCAMAHSEAS